MRIINQAKKYNKLPSEILRIDDEYTSFCFDEACMYITNEIEKGNSPKWVEEKLTIEEERNMSLNLVEQIKAAGGGH